MIRPRPGPAGPGRRALPHLHIGITSAAYIGIFSDGQHPGTRNGSS